MYAEIHKSQDNQFYFKLFAKNKKVIATGETYKAKGSATKTAKLFTTDVRDETKNEVPNKTG